MALMLGIRLTMPTTRPLFFFEADGPIDRPMPPGKVEWVEGGIKVTAKISEWCKAWGVGYAYGTEY